MGNVSISCDLLFRARVFSSEKTLLGACAAETPFIDGFFRRLRHLGDFRHLFLEVVRLAREAEIAALLDRAGEVDAEEDAVHEADSGDGEVPEEIARRENRLKGIRAAKARLEARQRAVDDAKGRKPGQDRNPRGGRRYKRPYGEPDAKTQENFTDPESRIMKTSAEGFQQCFNAQVAVDGGSQMIVATEVGQDAGDQGRLGAMLDRVEADAGGSPGEVLADAGHCSEEELAALE